MLSLSPIKIFPSQPGFSRLCSQTAIHACAETPRDRESKNTHSYSSSVCLTWNGSKVAWRDEKNRSSGFYGSKGALTFKFSICYTLCLNLVPLHFVVCICICSCSICIFSIVVNMNKFLFLRWYLCISDYFIAFHWKCHPKRMNKKTIHIWRIFSTPMYFSHTSYFPLCYHFKKYLFEILLPISKSL